ncbi:MAG: hypothetical protein ACRDHU_06525, partial [Actinomycetota bacterium]
MARDMGALAGSMRARVAPERRWPPTADPEGVDLSTGAVLGILAGVFLAELLAYVATAGSVLPAVSPFGSPNETATRLLVVPAAISAAISLGLVLLLGWRRAAGLALGSMSPWGVVPLVI